MFMCTWVFLTSDCFHSMLPTIWGIFYTIRSIHTGNIYIGTRLIASLALSYYVICELSPIYSVTDSVRDV